ncbi:MAG: DivIVA domain-containing protein [Firmicutes bacterium]|nr:DivIVA domain-containing protein [Bacillota bacterium]
MLTPLDIESKKFKKRPFGYSELEVEEFLTKIVHDYEKIYKENIEFKDKITALTEGIQHYKTIEETLQNTLIVAQKTGEEITTNAREKAETILKEAEIKAGQIIADANQEVTKINYQYEQTKRNYIIFKAKLETMFQAQLEILQDTVEEKSA